MSISIFLFFVINFLMTKIKKIEVDMDIFAISNIFILSIIITITNYMNKFEIITII